MGINNKDMELICGINTHTMYLTVKMHRNLFTIIFIGGEHMKKKLFQKALAASLAAAMALSLAACGSGSDTGSSAGTTSGTESGAQTGGDTGSGSGEIQSNIDVAGITNLVAERSETYANSATVKHDSITVCANGDPGNLLPQDTQTSGKEILDNIFEKLYCIDGFGGELLPAVAETEAPKGDNYVETVSELPADAVNADASTGTEWYVYTVTIRDNVYDSDGNNITASDVAYSYNWLMKNSTPQNMGKFKYAEASADDPYTVRFYCDLLDGVSDSGNLFAQQWIFSETAMNSHNFENDPVGTGPYKVSDYSEGSSVTLEARDDYWAEGQDYQLARYCANVQTIKYVIMNEAAQQANALKTGEVAFSNAIDEVELPNFLNDGANAADYVVYPYKENLTYYLLPNCDSASQCSDENLRKAIMYAVDGATIALASGQSTAEVAYDLYNSKFPEYRDSWKTEDNYYNNPSLDTAKEYLDQSDYDGSELVLLTMSAPPACQNVATVIATVLQSIGINCKLDVEDGAQVTSVEDDPANWDLVIAMMAADDYGVVDVSRLMSESGFSGDRQTVNFITDDKLQELIATCNSADGWSEESTQELHEYLIEHAYGRGLFCTTTFNVVSSDITELSMSFKFLPMFGGCVYSDNQF
jgi:ABC-type transport system substrate-binding protein